MDDRHRRADQSLDPGTRLRLDAVWSHLWEYPEDGPQWQRGEYEVIERRFCVLEGAMAGTCWEAKEWRPVGASSASHRDRVEPIVEPPTKGTMDDSLPFHIEGDLERRIAADPDWQAGVEWGAPRSGHPEGAVKRHIAEVLANLDRLDLEADSRRRLRVAALVHDTWKQAVDRSMERVPPNEHGFLAARWLERIVDDERLVTLVELHDEGYRAWRAHREGRDYQAWVRIAEVARRMGDDLALFLAFYWADNRTGTKTLEQVAWFSDRLGDLGHSLPVPDAGLANRP